MAIDSAIAWTRSTFNPWMLFPQAFAALQSSRVADAIRFEVSQFVARMAQSHAVADIVGKLGMVGHWLFVVSTQIAASIVAAVSACISIALKYSRAPCNVFRASSQAEGALELTAAVGVVLFPARGSFTRHFRNTSTRLRRVFLPRPIRASTFRRLAHFPARFVRVRPTLEQGRLTFFEQWCWHG